MSKLTIKGRSVQEATEPDINKAYNEFTEVLDGYSAATANFMKDCVYIAHSRGENLVNGLRKQGYKLNLAAQLDTDTLHTCYVKDENGNHKAIDLYFNPHKRVVEVVLLGFDPNYPNAETTKFFSVQKGADAFADFIESLSDYKGESKMKKCSMTKKIESLHKKTEMVGDDEELTFAFDGVNVTVHEWTPAGEQGRYVQEYTINERGTFGNLTDLINYIADKVAYDDDFKNPANWTAMEVDRGELEISSATLQDEDGDSDPDGNYIADFVVRITCSITKPMHQTEIHNALSTAKISM